MTLWAITTTPTHARAHTRKYRHTLVFPASILSERVVSYLRKNSKQNLKKKKQQIKKNKQQQQQQKLVSTGYDTSKRG